MVTIELIAALHSPRQMLAPHMCRLDQLLVLASLTWLHSVAPLTMGDVEDEMRRSEAPRPTHFCHEVGVATASP